MIVSKRYAISNTIKFPVAYRSTLYILKHGSFDNWNVVTDLFEKLRREDYHKFPVLIHVKERQCFPIKAIFEDDKSSNLLVFEGTWSLGNPFSTEPPDGIQLCLGNTKTGRPLDDTIEPVKRECEFILFPRTEEMRQAIEQA